MTSQVWVHSYVRASDAASRYPATAVASTTSVECFAAPRRYECEPVIPYCLAYREQLAGRSSQSVSLALACLAPKTYSVRSIASSDTSSAK